MPQLSWLPPRSLTARPWKMVVGRRYFPIGFRYLFRGYVKLRGCMLAKYGKMTSWEVSNDPFHKGSQESKLPTQTQQLCTLWCFDLNKKLLNRWQVLNPTSNLEQNKTKENTTDKKYKTQPPQKKNNPSTQESKHIKIIQKTKPNWNNLKQKPAFKHQKSRLRFGVCFSKLL